VPAPTSPSIVLLKRILLKRGQFLNILSDASREVMHQHNSFLFCFQLFSALRDTCFVLFRVTIGAKLFMDQVMLKSAVGASILLVCACAHVHVCVCARVRKCTLCPCLSFQKKHERDTRPSCILHRSFHAFLCYR
jgi:hypothetical protein